mgnify:CR=1 FL=1
MADTVFILGAGASRESGAPLMNDFLDVAYRLWKQKDTGEYKDDFENVFGAIAALTRVHSKSVLDIDNIESVFAAFEMGRTLNTFPERNPEDIPTLISSLKRVIVYTLERKLRFPVAGGRHIGIHPTYHQLMLLIHQLSTDHRPNLKSAIITFNYDIAIDMAIHCSGRQLNYGLGDRAPIRDAIPVLKLHGSLNWTTNKETGDIYPWYLSNYFSRHSLNAFPELKYCTMAIGSQLKHINKKKKMEVVTAEPVIVPPTWNKSDSHLALSKVWTEAAHELETAENIFIIGYSMPGTDAFFHYLYSLGTAGNTLLKRIWVFNPEKTGLVKQRFESMLGPAAKSRFEYFPVTFGEATGIISERMKQEAKE